MGEPFLLIAPTKDGVIAFYKSVIARLKGFYAPKEHWWEQVDAKGKALLEGCAYTLDNVRGFVATDECLVASLGHTVSVAFRDGLIRVLA
jgi:hypothetical protein